MLPEGARLLCWEPEPKGSSSAWDEAEGLVFVYVSLVVLEDCVIWEDWLTSSSGSKATFLLHKEFREIPHYKVSNNDPAPGILKAQNGKEQIIVCKLYANLRWVCCIPPTSKFTVSVQYGPS